MYCLTNDHGSHITSGGSKEPSGGCCIQTLTRLRQLQVGREVPGRLKKFLIKKTTVGMMVTSRAYWPVQQGVPLWHWPTAAMWEGQPRVVKCSDPSYEAENPVFTGKPPGFKSWQLTQWHVASVPDSVNRETSASGLRALFPTPNLHTDRRPRLKTLPPASPKGWNPASSQHSILGVRNPTRQQLRGAQWLSMARVHPTPPPCP